MPKTKHQILISEAIKFFEKADDSYNNACVNFGWNPNYGYVMGYKKAADFLAENAADIHKQDFFVYPIAFLYRHYIELRLKRIIDIGRQLFDTGEGFPQHHGIRDLWDETKAILVEVSEDIIKDDDFKITEDVINSYIKVDPTSMAFHYPTDKKGEKHLDGLRFINLKKLAVNMSKVEFFLESSLCMLIENLSYKEAYNSMYNQIEYNY